MKTNHLLLMAAGLILVFLATTQLANYSRRRPVERHQENLGGILKSDTKQSKIDSLERAEWNSQKLAYQDTIRAMKKKYSVMAKKDVQLESRYHKAPSVVGCDSVIDSKNSRIGALESMAHQQDQVARVNDSLLAIYVGSILDKDQSIHQLSAGYEQAIQDLEQAKKPKRWGLGLHVGYGVGSGLQIGPVVSIGLSYNLIRL